MTVSYHSKHFLEIINNIIYVHIGSDNKNLGFELKSKLADVYKQKPISPFVWQTYQPSFILWGTQENKTAESVFNTIFEFNVLGVSAHKTSSLAVPVVTNRTYFLWDADRVYLKWDRDISGHLLASWPLVDPKNSVSMLISFRLNSIYPHSAASTLPSRRKYNICSKGCMQGLWFKKLSFTRGKVRSCQSCTFWHIVRGHLKLLKYLLILYFCPQLILKMNPSPIIGIRKSLLAFY